MRVFSLTENPACITALGNDDGYENVFAKQLDTYLSPGDVVIAISASGNSPNVLRAVETAAERGARVLALAGFDGGALKHLADVTVLAESPIGDYEAVEDVHLMLAHILTRSLCRA
jgi:D-sedoheptulose 7-phosphate isomerase